MPKDVRIAQIKARKAWVLCCRHEGVNPSAAYAEFKKDNPYLKEYHKHMEKVLEYMTGE